MKYSEVKSKIIAARKLTNESPFKLERGYVYASFKDIWDLETSFIRSITEPDSFEEKRIWGMDSQSRLVQV